ncbi:MAG: pantoate--beta-alanine ligase [Actinomycetota bacterium]
MKTLTTFEAVRAHRKGSVGLVPTMGYLHEGHLSLIETAAARCDTVIVSVFVNPLQFGDAHDLDSYPADLPRDTTLATAAGADIVFAPDIDEMYSAGRTVGVTVADVGDAMEGTFRPGHFAGVATVVAKLFAGIQPDLAFFGRKDAQQLALVSTMVDGLSMPVDVVGCPIVRESDGLALSSRNTRLTDEAHTDAVNLSRALFSAGDLFVAGERSSGALKSAVRRSVAGVPSIDLEYVEVAAAATAKVVDEVTEVSFLALAGTVDGVRLIDNVLLDVDGTVDIGKRIEAQSILYGGDTCC